MVGGAFWHSVAALLLAAVVVMGSPGPANISVAAVGAAYGPRRALPYAAGLVLGTASVLAAVALGVVAIVMSVPHGAPVLTGAAGLYILYLAWRIATAPPLGERRAEAAAPALGGGYLLAIANPKAWLALAAVFAGTTVLPEDRAADALVKLALLVPMIVLIQASWLGAGSALARVLRHPTAGRAVNVAMALLLVATALASLPV